VGLVPNIATVQRVFTLVSQICPHTLTTFPNHLEHQPFASRRRYVLLALLYPNP